MVYLAKKNGGVIHHTDLQAMKDLDGINKPDETVTDQEWEAKGGTAHINKQGKIVLGEPKHVLEKRQEIQELDKEEALLQRELDSMDYKVIKAAESGHVLAETDPALHERRDQCRTRINEIRARLKELQGVAVAA